MIKNGKVINDKNGHIINDETDKSESNECNMKDKVVLVDESVQNLDDEEMEYNLETLNQRIADEEAENRKLQKLLSTMRQNDNIYDGNVERISGKEMEWEDMEIDDDEYEAERTMYGGNNYQ